MSNTQSALTRARRVRLAEGSVFYAAITALRACMAIGLTIVLARILGREGFGHWALLVAWASALTLFSDLGTGLWVTREAAQSPTSAALVVSSAVRLRLVALMAVGVPVTWLAMSIAGATETSAWMVAWCVALAGAAQGCFAAALRGSESLRALLVAEVVGVLTQAIGIGALVVLATPSATAVLVVAALAQAVQALMNWHHWRALRRDDSTRDDVDLDTRRHWAPGLMNALKASWPFAGLGLLAQLQLRWTPLALGTLGGVGELGLFGSAARVTDGLRLLPQGALGALFPVWASESAAGDVLSADAARARRRLLRWTTAAALVVSGAVIALAPAIVRLLFGPTFDDAVPPLRWLTLALSPGIASAVLRAQLLAEGRERAVAAATSGAVGLQMLSSLPLIGTLGATGAAISVLLGELATLWRLRTLASTRSTAAGHRHATNSPQEPAALVLGGEPNRR